MDKNISDNLFSFFRNQPLQHIYYFHQITLKSYFNNLKRFQYIMKASSKEKKKTKNQSHEIILKTTKKLPIFCNL